MATPSDMSSPKDVVSLFRFPREIRDSIYRNLLVCSYTLYLCMDSRTYGRRGWHYTSEDSVYTSILTTCKQVVFEATSILYTGNVFGFIAFDDMSDWLDTLNPENARALHTAEIEQGYDEMNMNALKKIFKRCTELKRLRYEWHMQSYAPPPERFVCGLFESAKLMLKDHPKLGMAACTHWGGTDEPKRQTYKVKSLTLVAKVKDLLPEDGEVFDIEEAIEQYAKSIN